ncbi:MAG: tripartite tricarboxylate transporter substrate binding protein [Burkholderiales bacterium]|nr:tripartite tricarboxylate transporter substrate binding protein [Burkholderiales bacterium]
MTRSRASRALAAPLAALVLGGLAALAPAGTARAQAWPAKPLRLVVPYPPSGSNDILSRVVAQGLTAVLGQSVVVDNRAGAGGMIGAENVAKSPPDGYSVLNVQASFVANAALRAKMAYDPVADFAWIGMMARSPMLVVVHPSLPVRNVRELVALAKARPGSINYGSTGTGGINHLFTELFRHMAGIDIVHVPYKGVAPALTDLMGGHVQLVMTSMPSALTQVQAGKLKAIAVGGARRTSFAPQLPTIDESGVRGYTAEFWWGLAAPVKTPPEIVNQLSAGLGKVLQFADTKERFAREGAEPAAMTREAFASFVPNEISRWRKVAREAGIRLE